MPALRNPRHERVCRLLVRDGLSLTSAYRQAGYRGDRRDAAKLRRRDDVGRRPIELSAEHEEQEAAAKAQALARTTVTVERVLRELAAIAFADLRRVAAWGPRGLRFADSTTLSEEDAAAIAEVTPATGRVRLHDKLSALEKLGKYLGMFSEIGLTPRQMETFMDGLAALLERHVSPDHVPHVLEGLQQLRLLAPPQGEPAG